MLQKLEIRQRWGCCNRPEKIKNKPACGGVCGYFSNRYKVELKLCAGENGVFFAYGFKS